MAAKTVKLVVDGREIDAPEGATLLQVMLDAGIDTPHYCYHPKLTIDGSCRLCSVKIEGMAKLQIACNTSVRDKMVVHTEDPDVQETRRGVLELLLLNHPLDCPICDKAGECWLQNYSMRFGSRIARTQEPRRKHGKRLDIGERMLLDQERCILCRRCVRFCREISKTGELVIFNRGDRSILDIGDRRLDNAYSICTADICPVGALETKEFHHRLRVWFLTETASVCPGCSNGCNIMIEESRNQVWRLMPRRNDYVNDTWMCDAGRLTYQPGQSEGRIMTPRIRHDANLAEAGWTDAIAAAAEGLLSVQDHHGAGSIGALISPHLTVEENFEYGQLFGALPGSRMAMAVRRGPKDDFLIKEEKAPNARGVRELGLVTGADDGLAGLLDLIESGQIKGLYVCGDDVIDCVDPERLGRILKGVEFLVVQAFGLRAPLDEPAVFLPTTSFTEKSGTFANYSGRLQRIDRAIEPVPGWHTDGEVFAAVRGAVTGAHDRFQLDATQRRISTSCPAFSSVAFGQIGPLGVQIGAEQSSSAGAEKGGV